MKQNSVALNGVVRGPRVWLPTASLLVCFGFLSLLLSTFVGGGWWEGYSVFAVVLLIILLSVVGRALRDGPARLFSDPFLIIVIFFAVYFVAGSLFIPYGSEDYVGRYLANFPVDAAEAFLVSGVNLLGLGILLAAGASVRGEGFEKLAMPIVSLARSISGLSAFLAFSIVGAAAMVAVVSFDLEGNEGLVISGTLRSLSALTYVAIMAGVLYEGRGRGLVYLGTLSLVCTSFIFGLALFNKTAALVPIIIALTSLYFRTGARHWLAVASVVAVLILSYLADPVLRARSIVEQMGGASVQVRLGVLWRATEREALDEGAGGTAWLRICYVGPQVAAMRLYDQGDGGSDIQLMGWAFLPRALFPEKPVMTQIGRELNYKILGRDTSSLGVGLFVSGYYNFGWLGVSFVAVISGFILSFLSALSRVVVRGGAIIFLPLAQVGSYMAFRVDGSFMSDYFGAFIQIAVPFLMLSILPFFMRIRS